MAGGLIIKNAPAVAPAARKALVSGLAGGIVASRWLASAAEEAWLKAGDIMSAVQVSSVAAGRVRLTVPGLRARPGCAGLVDDRLTGISGFRALRIFPRTGSVVIWVAPDHLSVERLVDALEEAPPAAVVAAKPSRSLPDTSTGEVARLVVGGAVLAFVALRRLLGRPRITLGSSGLLGVVTVFTGLPFFRGALRTLRGRSSPGTDTLVTAATIISLVLRENVVALTVLWLLNIGEFLQTLTLRRTRRAIEELLTIGDERVWLVREGVELEVDLETVEPGDTVAVYEHHRIPVDGHVQSGEALVDQAAVTGEALPVYAREGAHVYAGTIVTSGSLTIRADYVGRDTTVGRIISRVEEAQSDRAPIQTVATRFTQRFVPVSFALAALTYVVTRDARRAMTMLLIACRPPPGHERGDPQ